VDVEKRLLEDARSFAKEVASLDEEGFISRALAALGVPPTADDAALESENEEVPPVSRPHPAAGPPGEPGFLPLREAQLNKGLPIPSDATARAADCSGSLEHHGITR